MWPQWTWSSVVETWSPTVKTWFAITITTSGDARCHLLWQNRGRWHPSSSSSLATAMFAVGLGWRGERDGSWFWFRDRVRGLGDLYYSINYYQLIINYKY